MTAPAWADEPSELERWTVRRPVLPAEDARPRLPSTALIPDQRASVRLPGEFEPQASLLLGCGELAACFPQTLADIVEAAQRRLPVTALISRPEQRELVELALAERGLAPHAVRYAMISHNTMWIRDWGPLFVLGRRGRPMIVDAEYRRADRPNDETAPAQFARLRRYARSKVPIMIDGGNLMSNGEGVCLTTTALLDRNVENGRSAAEVSRALHMAFGAREVVVLEPLVGEPTGHVDMFATFVDTQTVVVAECDAEEDPANALILDRNANRLADVRTSRGPLRVVRLPMPSHEDGIWRTHTNVVFANGVLLMPMYADSDAEIEEAAAETYSRLLPGWEIAPIDVTELIRNGGALHCISMNEPAPAPYVHPWARLAMP